MIYVGDKPIPSGVTWITTSSLSLLLSSHSLFVHVSFSMMYLYLCLIVLGAVSVVHGGTCIKSYRGKYVAEKKERRDEKRRGEEE